MDNKKKINLLNINIRKKIYEYCKEKLNQKLIKKIKKIKLINL